MRAFLKLLVEGFEFLCSMFDARGYLQESVKTSTSAVESPLQTTGEQTLSKIGINTDD